MTTDEKLPAARDPKTGRLFPGRQSLNPAGRPKILGSRHARKILNDAHGRIAQMYTDVIEGILTDEDVTPRQWEGIKNFMKLMTAPPSPLPPEDDGDVIDMRPPPPIWDDKLKKWLFASENLRAQIGPPPWEENSERGDAIEATGQEATETMRGASIRS